MQTSIDALTTQIASLGLPLPDFVVYYNENRSGGNTHPCLTHLLIAWNSVSSPSTLTLAFCTQLRFFINLYSFPVTLCFSVFPSSLHGGLCQKLSHSRSNKRTGLLLYHSLSHCSQHIYCMICTSSFNKSILFLLDFSSYSFL